jgi:hypothetical protein
MSFEKRAEKIEQLFASRREAREDSEHSQFKRELFAIWDELVALKASGAVRYRGGVRIEPEDIPRKLLGENYTRAELRELSIARGLERRLGYSTAEVAELIPVWVERFEDIDRRRMEAAETRGGA